MYVALDMSGKVHASGQKTMDLAIRPESRKAVAANGLRLVTEIVLAPGHYQLRLAAHDPIANKSGSVFWDLERARLHKEPVSMGNLLLTAASAGRTPTSLDAPSVQATSCPVRRRPAASSRSRTRSRCTPRSTTTRPRAAHGRSHHDGPDRRRDAGVRDARGAREPADRRRTHTCIPTSRAFRCRISCRASSC